MENEFVIWLQIITMVIIFVAILVGIANLFISGLTFWAHFAMVGLALYMVSAFKILGGLV